LNFENIDILEDELRRSSNNNGQMGNDGAAGLIQHFNFNQIDSSIQRFGSSYQQ
jgi:hypothetical protein